MLLASPGLCRCSDDVLLRNLENENEVQKRLAVLRLLFGESAEGKSKISPARLFKLRNNNSSTALHVASWFGEVEIIKQGPVVGVAAASHNTWVAQQVDYDILCYFFKLLDRQVFAVL